jgi:hypothetical protein
MPSIHFPPPRRRHRPSWFCVLLACVAAIPTRAHSADDLQPANESEAVETQRPATAKEWSDHGLLQYRKGDFAEAIRSFETSYDLSKNPGLLFNIGQAHRLTGDCASAIVAYRRYLDEAPDGRYRTHAQKNLQSLDRCRSPEAAPKDPAPLASPRTEPAATEHNAPIAAFEGSKSVDVNTPFHRPRKQPDVPWKRTLVYSLTGMAGLLGLGAAFSAWRAHENSAELSDRYRNDGVVWSAADSETEATIQRQRTSAVVLVSAAVVCAIAGVSLRTYWHRSDSLTRQISLELTPGGTALAYSRRF